MYWDVAFWGLLNGSIVNFLGVYCSRIGASPVQMGLLTAVPALMNLIVTLPATMRLRGISATRIVPRAALITRLFYGLLVPLPLLLPHEMQIWVILGLAMLQNISGTIAATIGNGFLAENIPPEFRGQVVGNRNALVSMATMLTSLVVGQVLNAMSLESGYTVIFAIGFVGSLLSAYQLFQIRPVVKAAPDQAQSPVPTLPAPAQRGIRALGGSTRMEILRGPFGRLMLIMFMLNVGVFMLQPVFPLYQVNVLHLSDQTISLASALFGLVQFFVSTQGGRISHWLGFRRMTGVGIIIASISTLMFTLSFSPWLYFSTQFVGGMGWSIYGGGAINYLLENVPPDDRPAHLAWYNLVLNGAVLLCGLLAAQMVGVFGLFGGMVLGIAMRFLVGLLVLKFG